MERHLLRVVVCLAMWLALVAVAQAQTVVEYIHTDALGTPVAVTNSAGAVIERSVYEPYGQLINRALTDGPGFTGHVQDAATGLTYMQQRYYDPQVGVFLSVDPIAAYDTPVALFNRYRYANNNPFRFTDPDGRFGQPQCYGGRFCDSYKKSGCELKCVGREETEESRKKVSDEGDDALGPMKDRAYSILSKPAGDDGIVNLSMAEFGQLLDYEVAATELKSSLRGGYDNLSTIELLYEARVGDSLFYGDFGGVDYRITGTDGAVIGPYKGGDFNYIKQGIIFSEGKGARLDMHLIVQSWNISGGGTFLHTKRRQFIADIGYFYNEMKSDD